MIAPSHYIQGPEALSSLGRYLEKLEGADRVGVLITSGGRRRLGEIVRKTLCNSGLVAEWETFGGISSDEEVSRVCARWEQKKLSVLVAIGGGSCADAGKAMAGSLSIPIVIVPTLASTDAPCSALSVMYTPEGSHLYDKVYPRSPSTVLVDTTVIANSPKRLLVAGFGDALSTYYEARTVWNNPKALSVLQARPTVTAYAIAELSANLLFEHGEASLNALETGKPSDALERVVEANTLLSGIGFESGGIAASHAVANALTLVPSVHESSEHGEMVAIGLMTMLAMENQKGIPGRKEEMKKVGEFLASVGLPVCLEQIHLDLRDDAMSPFIHKTLSQWFCHNEPFKVDYDLVLSSLKLADQLGRDIKGVHGDAAFEELRK
mmetsp:Transcript_17909/g.33955  ORF Transcript_17909/g.33955 Transcript_17909/m.33955 type:complete len:380 (-) Transcript_17909:357-1496(-)|eukprot:CAMPEP_0170183532 /NCGR_PEP_ID=MMETSP0040_2-20121228/31019_1 /TAXON_ID=641309 /ORGANISM="Lotharella oceanica, Strain CCMP622" /LENGTH=379 /DNA_ID=CAMNT_0010429303 /DNA_START=115 /DNA_END=1254 /DNA_ORIENTATION=-